MKKLFFTLLIALCAQAIIADSGDSYYFQRAEEAYSKKDYDLCLHYCQEGVKANPKDGKCWAVIAEIHSKRQSGRYGEALQAAEKALEVLPKKDLRWRSFVHAIQGDVFYKISDFAASKEAYLAALSMEPENTTYLYDVADVCAALGEYDEAIRYYNRYLEIQPSTVYIYGEMAYAYYNAGNKAEAQRYCDLANTLGSGENNTAHRVLSRMAVDKSDYVNACREVARAMFISKTWLQEADTLVELCPDLLAAAIRTEVAKAPTDVETNATAAYCAFSMLRYFDALYYLHRKAEQSDAPQEVYPEIAAVYEDIEALDEAEKYYTMAFKTDSAEHMLRGMAQVARERGEFQEAIKYLRRALQETPTEGKLYYLIARNLYEAGLFDETLQTLDTARVLIEDEEWLIAIHSIRAEVFEAQGEQEKMQQELAAAQKMRKADDKRDEFYLIDALLGDTAALTRHAQALEKDPKAQSKGGWGALAQAYAILKDKDRTIEALRRNQEAHNYNIRVVQVLRRYAFLKDDPDFKALVAKYENLLSEHLAELNERLGSRDTLQNKIAELPFTRQGGVNHVKCTINGLPLYFVFDTGAADVSISSVEANFMLKNGYLTNADFMGKQNYVTATGEIHEGTIINLREVRVGDVVLRDIKASVIKNQSAPLLLGQSCFRRFGTVEVDNKAQIIRLMAQ